MYKSIKSIFAATACVALLTGATAYAETVWKPPAEIAPQTDAGAASAAPAATSAAPADAKADKEKSCNEQAKALKHKAKKAFLATCMKS
ncbi:MAG: hypothetical protein CTY15_14790 [Methylocystis sp.]|nr:MAG: hypothetical protein CTY15_14790 [Methylocystis sp.]